jgi:hypothetical protein
MLAEVAELALTDGDLEIASTRSAKLLELAVGIGDRERTLRGLAYLACAAARAGHRELAGRMYGVLEAERDHQARPTTFVHPAAHVAHTHAWSDPVFERGRRHGKRLPLQHAIEEALSHAAGPALS